jgi:hypothetical protein
MEINGQITADEISKSAKDLKIEKTCYDEKIINEYLKSQFYIQEIVLIFYAIRSFIQFKMS